MKNINLSHESEKILTGLVSSGVYHSAGEAISDALRLLEEYRNLRLAKFNALQQDIDIGLKDVKSGYIDSLTADELIEFAKKKKHKN